MQIQQQRRVGQQREVRLGLGAEDAKQGGVAAVVEDQVRIAAVGPFEDPVGIVPVFFQRLALGGEYRGAVGGDSGRGVVLGREDVAGGPADLGTEGFQRLDQHGGLDGHVEAAGDAGALEDLLRAELFAQRHQARHFGLGDSDFLVAERGKRDVANDIVGHGARLSGKVLRRPIDRSRGRGKKPIRMSLCVYEPGGSGVPRSGALNIRLCSGEVSCTD